MLAVGAEALPFRAPAAAIDRLNCLRHWFVRGAAGQNIDYYVPSSATALLDKGLRVESAFPTRMRTTPVVTLLSYSLVDRASAPLTTFVTDTSVNFRVNVAAGNGVVGIANLQFSADARIAL